MTSAHSISWMLVLKPWWRTWRTLSSPMAWVTNTGILSVIRIWSECCVSYTACCPSCSALYMPEGDVARSINVHGRADRIVWSHEIPDLIAVCECCTWARNWPPVNVIPPVLQLRVQKVKHIVQAQSQVGIRFSSLAFVWKIRPLAEQDWDSCPASIRRFWRNRHSHSWVPSSFSLSFCVQ